MIISSKEKIICNYYFKTLKEKNSIKNKFALGDKIQVTGSLTLPKNNTVPNNFNYKEYLYNNHIHWILNVENIVKIERTNNIFYKIKNLIIKKIENYKYSSKYLYAFILGDTSKINDEVLNSYRTNGISHLFAVSGMHVSLITGIILSILSKLKINNRVIDIIMFVMLSFYLFLTSFSPSVLRASMLFIFLTINKRLNLRFKTLDLILAILCINLIINPFLIYNIGFQYSYLISIGLIIFKDKLKNYNKYFLKILVVSIISFLIGLPITIYNFYQINVLSIFLNIIFVPLISFIIFPLSLITFIIPSLEYINNIFIIILENMSIFISKIGIFNIILAKPSIYVIFFYYIVICFVLYKFYYNKYIYLGTIGLMILIHAYCSYFNFKPYMITIDVGQGDSSLIVLPHNKGNILIDTGGIINYNKEKWMEKQNNYSLIIDSTIPMLKSFGIREINYLVLTHGDFDHMGEAINLVENFKVENVVFNIGEFNELEYELIKVLDKKKIKYYMGLQELNIGKDKLYFLNTKEYDNENDNSNVIYFKLNNYKFLFMGDAGVQREKDIIEKYNLTDIDFIKIGHHGSNTSSSELFIDSIKPKNCLISVGKNNRYGHPKESVIDTLDDYCDIYRTDLNGSIEIKISRNDYRIKTYSP